MYETILDLTEADMITIANQQEASTDYVKTQMELERIQEEILSSLPNNKKHLVADLEEVFNSQMAIDEEIAFTTGITKLKNILHILFN